MTDSDQPVDWRSMFHRYAAAVRNYDNIVGAKCLDPNSGWAPDWTPEEVEALKDLRRHAPDAPS